MHIVIDNRLRIDDPAPSLDTWARRRLTMDNPAYLEATRMGRWTGNIPAQLTFYERTESGLVVPRGFTGQVIAFCRRQGLRHELADNRLALPEVDFTFRGTLRAFQQEAADRMAERDFGTLSAPTGSGKTVMALALIARRRQPALVVVHTRELLEQWVERIGAFLGVPAEEVGRIGGGKNRLGDRITVALVQSLFKCTDTVSTAVGHLVVDECHRAPSRTFTEAVTAFPAHYMLGLSATPWRRDKLSKLIFWTLGDVVHEVPRGQLLESGDVLRAEVRWRTTNFRTWRDASSEYTTVLQELTEDPERNALIAEDVAHEAARGTGVALVLSDRKAHCEALRGLLRGHGVDAAVLTGDLPAREREQVVEDLNAGRVRVLVATGQLIGEGFDCKHLSVLFLATPVKFDGRLLQYLGRVLRPAPGKERAVVFDYVDENVPVLRASARARGRVYGEPPPEGEDAHAQERPAA